MREGIALGMMFNLIDSERGAKADLTPLASNQSAQRAFGRRIRRSFRDEQGAAFEAWCAHVDDIILGKLSAWQEGRSAKHLNDIATIVRFDAAGNYTGNYGKIISTFFARQIQFALKLIF